MLNKNSLLGGIQKKFPKTFESWDGFQTSIIANDREGLDPVIIVVLYNKPTEESPANLHRAFRLDVANDSIDSGDNSMIEDEMKRVYPELYARRDAGDKDTELTDDEEIASNSDRAMYLKQDLGVLNDNENNG